MTQTTPQNLGYSLAEWERARKMFGDQQLAVDLLGENNVRSWLNAARRSLAAMKVKQ